MNELGLYGLYERYDMGEAIVRERMEKAFSDILQMFQCWKNMAALGLIHLGSCIILP